MIIGNGAVYVGEPIGVVVAIRGYAPVEVSQAGQPPGFIVNIGGGLTQPVGHGLEAVQFIVGVGNFFIARIS